MARCPRATCSTSTCRPVSHQVSFVLRTRSEENVAVILDLARSAMTRDGPQLAVQETTTMQNVFDLAVGPAGAGRDAAVDARGASRWCSAPLASTASFRTT